MFLLLEKWKVLKECRVQTLIPTISKNDTFCPEKYILLLLSEHNLFFILFNFSVSVATSIGLQRDIAVRSKALIDQHC